MKLTSTVLVSAAIGGLAKTARIRRAVTPVQNYEVRKLGILFAALLALSEMAGAQSWLAAPKPPRSFSPGTTALQLTDGSIMVQERGTSNWWKLTPDYHADYNTGKWSQLAHSQWTDSAGNLVDYAPEFCASAVLPDGRVIVMGGEYNWVGGKEEKNDTTLGAIFDPTVGTNGGWTPVAPPKGWKTIGDAASIVLSDGTFMLSNCCDFPSQAALLDATTLTWKILTSKSDFTSKFDSANEEGWTLLPDGTVLTVDAYIHPTYVEGSTTVPTLANNSEIYTPGTGTWATAGDTVQPLSWLPAICGINGGHEVGPAILRPDATVFVTGVNACGGAGHTAIYHFGGAFWTAGPDIPCEGSGSAKVCNDMADAPAAILQDGNVLVQTSPGINKGSSTFYEFDFKTNKFSAAIPAPPGLTNSSSEFGRMLVAASGHVFFMHVGGSDQMWFYVPKGTYDPVWEPLVNAVTGDLCLGCVVRGKTYTITGAQFNGLSQGAAYGDDAQSATNYPLVRIDNCETGSKFFARTHDFTMGVSTGFNPSSTQFDVPAGADKGASSLIVIANGIPSEPAGGACSVTVF